jgi:hypothetical protein
VTRRRDSSGADGRTSPQTATDAEAASTAIVIAGLRWRLRRQGTLKNPAVLGELRKLDEQVTAQLEQDRPGRHRSPASKTPGRQIADTTGFDLKPNPLTVTSAAEFITTLRQYRAWSGDPSWRKMATRAGQAVVHSTMHAAISGDALPKFDVVKAFVIGCGGSEEDLRAFITAWRRLDSGRARRGGSGTDLLAAPVTSLSLVPGG